MQLLSSAPSLLGQSLSGYDFAALISNSAEGFSGATALLSSKSARSKLSGYDFAALIFGLGVPGWTSLLWPNFTTM